MSCGAFGMPSILSATFPSLNSMIVGSASTLYFDAMLGYFSVFIFCAGGRRRVVRVRRCLLVRRAGNCSVVFSCFGSQTKEAEQEGKEGKEEEEEDADRKRHRREPTTSFTLSLPTAPATLGKTSRESIWHGPHHVA